MKEKYGERQAEAMTEGKKNINNEIKKEEVKRQK